MTQISYISYHNTSLINVCHIVVLLREYHPGIWFDQHEIPLYENRGRTLLDATRYASSAIIFISNMYLHTSYCIEELAQIQNRGANTIAVILEDVDLSRLDAIAPFSHTIDARNSKIEAVVSEIIQSLTNFAGIVENSNEKSRLLTQQERYILNLINAMEAKLSHTIPARSRNLMVSQADTRNGHINIRPRNYTPSLIKAGAYKLLIDGEELALEDLVALIEIQPLIVLEGSRSSGKSIITWLLVLYAAHEYRMSITDRLPVYLDCRNWQKTQLFSDFVHANWPDWNSDSTALFIIEVDSTTPHIHPDFIEEIEAFCMTSRQSSFVVAHDERWYKKSNPAYIAKVSIQPLTDQLLEDFAELFLTQDKQEIFLARYREIEEYRYERYIGYVSLVIENLNSDTPLSPESPTRHMVKNIIQNRWKQVFRTVIPISYNDFLTGLKYLAWTMTENENPALLDYQKAVHSIGDSAIIELGIEIGVVEYKQDIIEFTSSIIQEHLAAELLMSDGIYKHIQQPVFSPDGHLIETQWDNIVIALPDVIEPDLYVEVMEYIDDINPFSGVQFALRDTMILRQYLCRLVNKLIDIRLSNTLADRAVMQSLTQLPPSFMEEVAACLSSVMMKSSSRSADTIYGILSRLPLFLPENVLTQIRSVQRDFHDSMQVVLKEYPLTHWLIYANPLLHHEDPVIRRNAISLYSISANQAAIPALCSLLSNNTESIIREAIHAISVLIPDEDYFEYFLNELPLEYFDLAPVRDIFITLNRPCSAYLTELLDSRDAQLNYDFCRALTGVNDEVAGLLFIHQQDSITRSVESTNLINEMESEPAMKLDDLIRASTRRVEDRTILDKLFEDISRGLDNRTSRPAGNGEKLLARTREAIHHAQGQFSAMQAPHNEDAIPAHLIQNLDSDDWLLKFRALEELSHYPLDKMIDKITTIAMSDEEVQVRITAFDLLGRVRPADAKTIELLVEALQDEDQLIVDTVTDIIHDLEQFDSELILPLLGDRNIQAMVAAIGILKQHPHPDAVPDLAMLLDDDRIPWLGEKTVSDFAAEALQSIATPEARQAIENYSMKSNRNEAVATGQAVRNSVQKQNGKFTDEERIHKTLIALRGNDWELSQKAGRYLRKLAKSLRGTTNQNIIRILENNLNDANWTVRLAVLEALSWIQSQSSIPKFLLLLQDANWMVRISAVRGLVELGARNHAKQIAELIDDNNTAVAEATIECLGILKNDEVVEDLVEALESTDEFVRLAAIKALYQILDDAATPYFLSMLGDPYSHIRWFAIKHLSEQANNAHIEEIARLLSDKFKPRWEKKAVSDYALAALRATNTPESLAIINSWISKKH